MVFEKLVPRSGVSVPASTYHLGLPTNVPDRRRNAAELLDTPRAHVTT
jgi:hypothetical protein